jgi:hypothetical protein
MHDFLLQLAQVFRDLPAELFTPTPDAPAITKPPRTTAKRHAAS